MTIRRALGSGLLGIVSACGGNGPASPSAPPLSISGQWRANGGEFALQLTLRETPDPAVRPTYRDVEGIGSMANSVAMWSHSITVWGFNQSQSDAAFYGGSMPTILLNLDCADPRPCEGLEPEYWMQFRGAFVDPRTLEGTLEIGRTSSLERRNVRLRFTGS